MARLKAKTAAADAVDPPDVAPDGAQEASPEPAPDTDPVPEAPAAEPTPEEQQADAPVDPPVPEEQPAPEQPQDVPPVDPVPESPPTSDPAPTPDSAPAPEAPSVVPEPAPEEPQESTVVSATAADMTAMCVEFEDLLRKVKQPPKGTETLEVIRLGAAQILRDALAKITEANNLLAEMRLLDQSMHATQKGLEDAKTFIQEKTEAHRGERDAYLKLRGLSEVEFASLLAAVRAKA